MAIIEDVARKFRSWQAARRTESEIAGMSEAVVAETARDIGLSSYELTHRATANPDSEILMGKRLAAMGIDEKTLAATHAAVHRDMQRVCACCDSAKACTRDMKHGDVATGHCTYCGNSGTIDALIEEKKRAEG